MARHASSVPLRGVVLALDSLGAAGTLACVGPPWPPTVVRMEY